MTTYHLRGTDGTEVFTGTIEPPPGSGSQPGVAPDWILSLFNEVGGGFFLRGRDHALTWEGLAVSADDGQIANSYQAAWNGTEWLICSAGGGLYRSTNGLDWTFIETPNSSPTSAVVWNGSQWVIGGLGGGWVIATGPANPAPDGSDWTVQTTPFDSGGNVNGAGLAWDGANFVALCFDGAGSKLMTSPDAVAWTEQTTPYDGGGFMLSVATNGTTWVVLGGDGTTVVMKAPASDVTTWTGVSSPGDGQSISIVPASVIWDGTHFWAGLAADPLLMRSANGTSGWAGAGPHSALSQVSTAVGSIGYDGDALLLVNTSSPFNMWRSTDGGEAWAQVSFPWATTGLQPMFFAPKKRPAFIPPIS